MKNILQANGFLVKDAIQQAESLARNIAEQARVFCPLCKAAGRIECNACDGRGGYEYVHDFNQIIKN